MDKKSQEIQREDKGLVALEKDDDTPLEGSGGDDKKNNCYGVFEGRSGPGALYYHP